MVLRWAVLAVLIEMSSGYWDVGTTTIETDHSGDQTPRQSFFRWQKVEFDEFRAWWPQDVVDDQIYRRHLCVVAGVSIDDLPLGTAVILNRRTLITSANLLDRWVTRQKDLRVWALGRTGLHMTPYRYRVWRVRRVLPRSLNSEHWHGPKGLHTPRHDVAIIHTWDQMYIYFEFPTRYMYAYHAWLKYTPKHYLMEPMFFVGSGFEYLQHIQENYKIYYALVLKSNIVNCERYLPKWWGKFICIINHKSLAGVPLGGGLFAAWVLDGLGCFEIRYNDDRIFVFTDLRYYHHWITTVGNYSPYEYYEYSYPQWGVRLGWLYDGHGNDPVIPTLQAKDDQNFVGFSNWK